MKELVRTFRIPSTISTEALMKLIGPDCNKMSRYIQFILEGHDVKTNEQEMRRLIDVAKATGASLIFSDFRELNADGLLTNHPLANYQGGSVRDDFDFGHMFLVSTTDLDNVLFAKVMAPSEFSGLYSMRLGLQLLHGAHNIVRVPEYLYVSSEADNRQSGEKQFDYVNPRNAEVQKDREGVFTKYLSELDALVPSEKKNIDLSAGEFPLEASVIIPVRDRARTIAEAVESALNQSTDFPFNVIVVDNHSTDGTTEILSEIAAGVPQVVHIIPDRRDLGIGGCWDLAIRDSRCGRFAIQLDSDDKYKDDSTLQQIVDKFRQENCAMVIGSYELTDFDGNPLPPGLIDHKEWTDENGANNALRINGLGAPRAFFTPILREIGVPNVSYGEDYALGLRISREWRIGRIYQSLYLCRRWGGNSDANLSQERTNVNNSYKDWLRTIEIDARRRINELNSRRPSTHMR